MKKLKYFLQKWDGIWSLPLAFFAFIFVGDILISFGGMGTGTYDIGFLQPLFLAAAIVIGATNAAVLGIYFTLRELHSYLYGKEYSNLTPTVFNQSKIDFKNLEPMQKIATSLLVLFAFIAIIILVYLKLV